jgi:hypothetical protein
MRTKKKKRPGWYFIETCMPDATPEDQEAAHENLREIVQILVSIDDRLGKEYQEKPKRVKPSLW